MYKEEGLYEDEKKTATYQPETEIAEEFNLADTMNFDCWLHNYENTTPNISATLTLVLY